MSDLFGVVRLDGAPLSPGIRTSLSSRDGRLELAADVRLDDRAELRRSLRAAGRDLSSESDDLHLLMAAFEAWGPACVDRLTGDFAFVVWEPGRRRLFCARDPAGARPFHYHLDEGRIFVFGSWAADVLAVPSVGSDLDGFALLDFLQADLRGHTRSMYAAVRRLAPGCCLVVTPETVHGWRYFRPEESRRPAVTGDEAWTEEFSTLLRHAVEDRLPRDGGRPAVMLSGGLDSSAVAVVARELLPSDAGPLAISGVFDEVAACDERRYSRAVARAAEIELEEIPVDGHAVTYAGQDDPVEHPALLPEPFSLEVFRRARARGCGVLWSGLGGDSLFDAARLVPEDLVRSGRLRAAWPWWLAAWRSGLSWPRVVRSLLLRPLIPESARRIYDRWRGAGRYRHVPTWLDQDLARRLDLQGRLEARTVPKRFRSRARQRQYEDLVDLAQLGLMIDFWGWHGRRHGLESAHPLLDRRLAELVMAAPLQVLAGPGAEGSKRLLRRAMDGRLTETVRRRADKGSWGAWYEHVYRCSARENLRRMFEDSRLAALGLVEPRRLLQSYDRFCRDGSSATEVAAWSFPIYAERWLRSSASDGMSLRFDELRPWQRDVDRVSTRMNWEA